MRAGSTFHGSGLLRRLVVGRRAAPRTGGAEPRPLIAARRARIAVAVGLCAVTAWSAFATVGLIASQRLLADRERELARLEGAAADSDGLGPDELRAELARARAAERAAVERFAEFRATVRRQAETLEREVAALVEERDAAVDLARSLRESLDEARAWLRAAVDEKAGLRDELALMEASVIAVAQERDVARRESAALVQRAERLEGGLERLRDEQRTALARLRTWVANQVEALETLFASTGLDPERLIARAIDPGEIEGDGGQGGPLRLVLPEDVGVGTGAGLLDPEIDDAFGRMLVLHRLLAGLPLAAPLGEFRVTSLFGERGDPFTRQRAFHEGIDFVAARGAEVLATAPGRVVHAGPAGAYGNMVEIDHGLGVITRYGHLKEVTVAVDDEVASQQPIGIIGSTGRSTGRHLHYEVRIDDEPLDPAKFLSAGDRLVYAFK